MSEGRVRHWIFGIRDGRVWLWLAALIIVLDQGTKWWIVENLHFAQVIPVAEMLDITRLHNTGAAFSFLSDAAGWQRWLFTGLAVGVSIAIMFWLRKLPARGQGWVAAALALVLGGALGNVIDRVVHAHVIDFIHVHWQDWYFPAFNVADSAITVGAAILIFDSLFGRREETQTADY